MDATTVRLTRHEAGGYSYQTPRDGCHLRIVKSFATDIHGNLMRSKPRWEILDNGNEMETCDSLAEAREWCASFGH